MLCCAYSGDNPSVLDEVKQDVYSLSSHIHQFAFDIVFAPLKVHLADIPNMQVSRLTAIYLNNSIDESGIRYDNSSLGCT